MEDARQRAFRTVAITMAVMVSVTALALGAFAWRLWTAWPR